MQELFASHESVTTAGEPEGRDKSQYSQRLIFVNGAASVPAGGVALKNSAVNVELAVVVVVIPIVRIPTAGFPTGKVNEPMLLVIFAIGPLTYAPLLDEAVAPVLSVNCPGLVVM